MNNNLIKKNYLKKIKLINKYDKFYYDKNDSVVSDQEYDKLKKDIIEIEKKYPNLKNKESPSLKVGFKPSKNFKKFKHKIPMLSLSNAFDRNDLKNFEKKIINFLSLKENVEIEYSTEPKIDGISASLIYEKGILAKGLSRGDGIEGEDITENLKTISDIPKKILSKDFPNEIDIRGEVFITKKDFKKMDEKFANARNAASGSLRQKNPNETKKIPLKFIAYTFGYIDNDKIKTQSDFLSNLNNWGFKTSQFNKIIKGIEKLTLRHKKFEEKRFDLDYDVDGLVYKVNKFDLQKRLGFVANAPRWAVAHKFSANSSTSKILNIDIQVGRTGALTPVAKIEPVNISGVVVSNATLHNEHEINRKDIRIGDVVKVERAGDVIPHVVSVDISKRQSNSEKYIFPKKCPSCGSKTTKDFNATTNKFDAVRRCLNEDFKCEKIAMEGIKHFVSKEALNIDGFGKKIVEKFWELKLVKFPQDIFNLNFGKIKELDGWGDLSVSNLKYAIEKSKKISLDKFIYSLGIRHIGQENAKLLSQHLRNFENFYKLSKANNVENLSNIDGIGETQINSIRAFFSNKINLNVLEELKKTMKILNATSEKKGGILMNKTFMFTGKLQEISRAEAKSLVEENSGKIISNVNKKLNYLVIGEKPTIKKINKAKELNIKILTQNEWIKMLNKTS
tara:strand:+ start:147 stop:2177 length:2031 start_codon:yes stop_codon:yes gene_type:complete